MAKEKDKEKASNEGNETEEELMTTGPFRDYRK